MAKHTPGPWKITGNLGRDIRADRPFETLIAEVYQSGGLTGEITQANARLIANAPELVKTLRDLLLDTGRAGEFARDRARALLAEING